MKRNEAPTAVRKTAPSSHTWRTRCMYICIICDRETERKRGGERDTEGKKRQKQIYTYMRYVAHREIYKFYGKSRR